MAEPRKKGLISHGVAAQNRKGRFDYAIGETVEAGIVLKGPEVKSLRMGRATLGEAWAGEREGEMWLFNAHIPEYQGGVLSRFEPRAPRKLLDPERDANLLGERRRRIVMQDDLVGHCQRSSLEKRMLPFSMPSRTISSPPERIIHSRR